MSTSDIYGSDIYTEPNGEWNTLENLGPLRPMAGVWEGTRGSDEHPVAEGMERDVFAERYELQPIDFQTNGPQLFYGLRYHTHIVKPGDPVTFHDQVGYWLWEPQARAVTVTLGIPRGQVLLATGFADIDAIDFEVHAVAGTEINGILSNPFLYRAFRTLSYRMHVVINDDATWSYDEEGVLQIPGSEAPFSHIDRNTLRKISEPTPNPMARRFDHDTGLNIGDLRRERGNVT